MLQKGSKGCTQKILGMWLRREPCSCLLQQECRLTGLEFLGHPTQHPYTLRKLEKKTTLLHKHVLSSGTTGQILTRPFAIYLVT